MKEGALRKPLFIRAQDWYKAGVCVDCQEYKLISLTEGAVAYCNLIEEGRSCTNHPTETILLK